MGMVIKSNMKYSNHIVVIVIYCDYFLNFSQFFSIFLNFFWGSNTNKCIGQVRFSQFFSIFHFCSFFLIFFYHFLTFISCYCCFSQVFDMILVELYVIVHLGFTCARSANSLTSQIKLDV